MNTGDTIAVLTEGYPSLENPYSMAFVHSRSVAYQDLGLKVTVYSFSARVPYTYEGITVYPPRLARDCDMTETVVSHAPNIRHHLPWLLRKRPKRLFLIFHGHEALNTNKYYPPPYPKLRPRYFNVRRSGVAVYDHLKLRLLRAYINHTLKRGNIKLIFVSEWMRRAFLANVRVPESMLYENSVVIPNPANQHFLSSHYDFVGAKKFDFITIRPFDDPKYGVDLVLQLAESNPRCSFHIFGKGKYFEHYSIPSNVHVQNGFLSQREIPQKLSLYRAALMPTRLDAQGVMMCEMAAFGIPLVTSDLPICREMLEGFSNVLFLNDFRVTDISERIQLLKLESERPDRFNPDKTVLREARFISSQLAASS